MKVWLSTLVLLLVACARPTFPDPAPTVYAVRSSGQFSGDTLYIEARNAIAAPLLLQLSSRQDRFRQWIPDSVYTLAPGATRVLRFGPIPPEEHAKIGPTLAFRPLLDTTEVVPDTSVRYLFPFPPGQSYAITQAYHGSFSHDRPNSRYAIDFLMPPGDTVCAARDGIVIEYASENSLQGTDRRYSPYGNYLTLYHPDGVISQYVHLQRGGILVDIGDVVRAGQPIGIAGFTGFTTVPHLHFNVCTGLGEQRRSIPIRFREISGADLRKGMEVSNRP